MTCINCDDGICTNNCQSGQAEIEAQLLEALRKMKQVNGVNHVSGCALVAAQCRILDALKANGTPAKGDV